MGCGDGNSGFYTLADCGTYFEGANNLNPDCKPRFGNKDTSSSEQDLIGGFIGEAICQYGTQVAYYVHTYNPLSADNLYGENPTAAYSGPTLMTIMVEPMAEDALYLSQFGWRADDEFTAYITFTAFASAFAGQTVFTDLNQPVEPKSDDIVQLVEYGSTRPGDRGGKYFILTERTDQDISSMNPLGGHYMWRFRAKRFEWSFEPGLSAEEGSHQVYDGTFFGRLSGSTETPPNSATEIKTYEFDIDTKSVDDVYNMNRNNNSPYGDYY